MIGTILTAIGYGVVITIAGAIGVGVVVEVVKVAKEYLRKTNK